MLVGVPKEIKDNEFRVGMTPAAVAELVHHGHKVIVETSAGLGSGSLDDEYVRAGGKIAPTGADVFAEAQMIVKVKEPLVEERKRLKRGQILFTYLHLAPDLEQTRDLMASGATCIAYETVTSPYGGLPLLTPMSEVAGRLRAAGRGAFPGEGARRARRAARRRAGGGGGQRARARRRRVGNPRGDDRRRHGRVRHRGRPLARGAEAPLSRVRLVLADGLFHPRLDRRSGQKRRSGHRRGASAWRGRAKLITREMLKTMRPGAVIVDIAIDQGGCCETSKPTTHSHPTYVVDGIVHYCVANMPGAVARTSTFALNHATLPFALALADKGWVKALKDDPHLRAGLNVHDGKITCEPVAAAHGLPYTPAETVLGGVTGAGEAFSVKPVKCNLTRELAQINASKRH